MAPTSKLGRGKPLKGQTKEVLYKIYRYFETEIERDPNSTVTAAQLVAHSTGISVNAIKKALTDYKAKVAVKKECNPTKRRVKNHITVDDYAAQTIRRVIYGFYHRDEEFPTMKNLYLILKGDIDYQGSLCTLRRDVKRIGFKWMEKDDYNSILIEKHEFRYTRVQYLSKIESYRNDGRNIVYTGEIAIESNRIASKPRSDGSSTLLKQPAKLRCIILLAGDENELMKNTVFMYNNNRRDLKEENESPRENFDQYEKWFKFHLLPSLKPNSVVIVDGGSNYHNRVLNPCPHSNSKKKEMMDYLTTRNVPYTSDMYKPHLYQLVLLNKDKFNDYRTDSLLREYGHTVIRIPARHPDLNPVKNILGSVKSYIGKDLQLNVESVMKIAKERILSVASAEWHNVTKLAEAEENDLKASEKRMDDISEGNFRDVDEDSEESEAEDDSDQESMDSD